MVLIYNRWVQLRRQNHTKYISTRGSWYKELVSQVLEGWKRRKGVLRQSQVVMWGREDAVSIPRARGTKGSGWTIRIWTWGEKDLLLSLQKPGKPDSRLWKGAGGWALWLMPGKWLLLGGCCKEPTVSQQKGENFPSPALSLPLVPPIGRNQQEPCCQRTGL